MISDKDFLQFNKQQVAEPQPDRFIPPGTMPDDFIKETREGVEMTYENTHSEQVESDVHSYPHPAHSRKEAARNIMRSVAAEILLASNHQNMSFEEIDQRLDWTVGTTENFMRDLLSDKAHSDLNAREMAEIAWALGGKFEFQMVVDKD